MAQDRRRWTREELLLALHLYWRLPFGQQSSTNRDIIQLANRLDRTPGSVAMKLNNLTSLDPDELARGIVGLKGASNLDRAVWEWAAANPVNAAAEMESTWRVVMEEAPPEPITTPQPKLVYDGAGTETTSAITSRLGQQFFRRVVLANFHSACGLTGMTNPALLRASHIVAWSESDEHRVQPGNGVALNALHDAAFDKHLISFDNDLRLLVGKRLRDSIGKALFAEQFLAFEGQRLRDTAWVPINKALIAAHRERYLSLEAS